MLRNTKNFVLTLVFLALCAPSGQAVGSRSSSPQREQTRLKKRAPELAQNAQRPAPVKKEQYQEKPNNIEIEILKLQKEKDEVLKKILNANISKEEQKEIDKIDEQIKILEKDLHFLSKIQSTLPPKYQLSTSFNKYLKPEDEADMQDSLQINKEYEEIQKNLEQKEIIENVNLRAGSKLFDSFHTPRCLQVRNLGFNNQSNRESAPEMPIPNFRVSSGATNFAYGQSKACGNFLRGLNSGNQLPLDISNMESTELLKLFLLSTPQCAPTPEKEQTGLKKTPPTTEQTLTQNRQLVERAHTDETVERDVIKTKLKISEFEKEKEKKQKEKDEGLNKILNGGLSEEEEKEIDEKNIILHREMEKIEEKIESLKRTLFFLKK